MVIVQPSIPAGGIAIAAWWAAERQYTEQDITPVSPIPGWQPQVNVVAPASAGNNEVPEEIVEPGIIRQTDTTVIYQREP
jgi:hypothetical protein